MNTWSGKRWLVVLLVLLLQAAPAQADIKIKLATLAPQGTVWYDGLMELRDEWARLSNGEVKLIVYPGGVAGEEGDVVRKMRIGQLQAGSLTSYGMGKIDVALRSFSMPLLFRDYAELDHTLAIMGPEIEKFLDDKGFVALQWTDAGWLHFFSTQPIRTPQDLKSMKIGTSPDVPEADTLWKAMGYEPIPLANPDVLMGFQNGLIQAVSTAPLFALAQQWFGVANHMTRIMWVPVFGGTLVNKKTWEKIPKDLQPKLKDAANRLGEKIRDQVRADYDKIVQTMVNNGLKVIEVDQAGMREWEKFVDQGVAMAPKDLFSVDWLHRIQSIVEQYRNSAPK